MEMETLPGGQSLHPRTAASQQLGQVPGAQLADPPSGVASRGEAAAFLPTLALGGDAAAGPTVPWEERALLCRTPPADRPPQPQLPPARSPEPPERLRVWAALGLRPRPWMWEAQALLCPGPGHKSPLVSVRTLCTALGWPARAAAALALQGTGAARGQAPRDTAVTQPVECGVRKE